LVCASGFFAVPDFARLEGALETHFDPAA